MDDPSLPPLYGIQTAPGLVIAIGSVGHYLTYTAEEQNVFFSEDGGLNWRHVGNEPHMYEIGDQGGLVVMSQYKKSTNHVKFSYDFGRTWFFIKFLEQGQDHKAEVVTDIQVS